MFETQRPIPRNIFIKARAEFKKYLDLNFDQENDHPVLGPPSIGGFLPQSLPRHLNDVFLEQMAKSKIISKHPLGGYMDARYKFREIDQNIVKKYVEGQFDNKED